MTLIGKQGRWKVNMLHWCGEAVSFGYFGGVDTSMLFECSTSGGDKSALLFGYQLDIDLRSETAL